MEVDGDGEVGVEVTRKEHMKFQSEIDA